MTSMKNNNPASSYRDIDEITIGASDKNAQIQSEITKTKPIIPHVDVCFYTQNAINLLTSSTKKIDQNRSYFVTGMDWFDTKIKAVINAARDDDPFADQLLYDLEIAILTNGNAFKNESKLATETLAQHLSRFDSQLKLNDHMHQYRYKVTLQNRLSYDLLWSLKELDKAIYYYYLCDKYSALSKSDIQSKNHEMIKAFRATMLMINSWKSTSITREDIAQNTQRVSKTFELNNKIDLTKEVLLLQTRAQSAPEIRGRKNNTLPPAMIERIENIYS